MVYYSQITGVFAFPFPTESNPEPFVLGKYNNDNAMTIFNEGGADHYASDYILES